MMFWDPATNAFSVFPDYSSLALAQESLADPFLRCWLYEPFPFGAQVYNMINDEV
jgi:hypothetical protein